MSVVTITATRHAAPTASPTSAPGPLLRRENMPSRNTASSAPNRVPAMVLMISITLLPSQGAARAAAITSAPSTTVNPRLARSDRFAPPSQSYTTTEATPLMPLSMVLIAAANKPASIRPSRP